MASFGEKVLMCLEDALEFSSTFKKIHDIFECDCVDCHVEKFCDELYGHVHSKRGSPCFIKNFF